MKIVYGDPPNIDKIQRAFGFIKDSAYFCYGDAIYTRMRRDQIDLGVVKHETIHSEQQRRAGGPEAWWDRYLADPMFRREQEVAAYRAQIAFYKLKLGSLPGGRKLMREIVLRISKEMAGPMYGRMVTRQQAVELLTGVRRATVPAGPRPRLEIPPEWDAQPATAGDAALGPVRERRSLRTLWRRLAGALAR